MSGIDEGTGEGLLMSVTLRCLQFSGGSARRRGMTTKLLSAHHVYQAWRSALTIRPIRAVGAGSRDVDADRDGQAQQRQSTSLARRCVGEKRNGSYSSNAFRRWSVHRRCSTVTKGCQPP